MDGPGPIPDELRSLLCDQVESFEGLRVLLLLHGTSGRSWSKERIAEELKERLDEIERAVAGLCASGLLSEKAGKFEYQAGTLSSVVDLLAKTYAEDQMSVMKVLSARAVERIRTGAIRAFADAFVVKGRKENG